MVFGPTTYRMFSSFVLAGVEFDPWGPAAEFDLELLESQTLDGRTQELTYAPTVHPVRPR